MLTIKYIEDFSELYEEVGTYFEDHYTGCEEYRAGNKKLNIDFVQMQSLIDAGAMNWFLFKDKGVIVGYANVSITYSPIFSEPQAVIDFIYILPEHRRSSYASEAIKQIEKELGDEGLKDINILLPKKEYSKSVADSLGYTETSTVCTKCLGDK